MWLFSQQHMHCQAEQAVIHSEPPHSLHYHCLHIYWQMCTHPLQPTLLGRTYPPILE